MSTSAERTAVASPASGPLRRLAFPLLAAGLALITGLATAWAFPETTIRYTSFATMMAAVASGVVAVRRGPGGVRAVSAVVAVIALMLGSTFFGLTYS